MLICSKSVHISQYLSKRNKQMVFVVDSANFAGKMQPRFSDAAQHKERKLI